MITSEEFGVDRETIRLALEAEDIERPLQNLTRIVTGDKTENCFDRTDWGNSEGLGNAVEKEVFAC